ncbi:MULTISPECIES: TrbC/VirB2 family protein [Aurantimonadaceae]|uniref:Type IV secretion system protein VirB2 n=2 Tax=Jiella TaxID=1775688 RepID=A0A6N9TAK6_9HYPH|nr:MULTISPECIES: TrbC/VirB2 family protein [Aurantimonadaceae]MAU95535.1 hypothetical protein [Fulvimarina sp.]NDW06739.1 hypothetical protein [Jiella pacifica]ORE97052.1 hypothetical protein ATO4_11144 [Aurantimonas sp. 22II-16-19i]WAP71511.1 TrbC/VirB2 family protein [Jiella pelagia]
MGLQLNTVGRIAATAATLTVVSTGAAMAQDLSPVTNFFTTIGDALTGTLGRAIGLVALAGVGLAFATGRMNWMFAGSVLIGLSILFGAATLLSGYS